MLALSEQLASLTSMVKGSSNSDLSLDQEGMTTVTDATMHSNSVYAVATGKGSLAVEGLVGVDIEDLTW